MAKRRKTGGPLIAARLEEFGWKPTELAEKLGVPDGTVSRWISEARSPSLSMGVELAKVLGVEVADLIPSKRTAA